MLGFPRVRAMLDRAQVTRSIQSSGDLYIFHDPRGIVALLSRWCIPTHTFICSWGEFTITLEDVVALLHLPITCNFPEELSTEEKAISNTLIAEMERINKASGKGCYAHWLTHWWPRDVPLDEPDDSSVSNGFMKIECYANTMFLQALVWECFEKYAPIPRSILQGLNVIDSRYIFPEKDKARIMRWSTKQPESKTRFIDEVEDESEFNFRPWVLILPHVSQLITFNHGESMALKYGTNLSDGERSFMLSCTPGYLIAATYGDFSVEEYNIDRASRQMGMDQCVPTFRRIKPSME
ncbi:uncharacterized protein LOC113281582 [Papaver somniferum]|uniref:uncharacterized protein LOC113281582 n=1 Tax=Papaver somniferum TaxID=3469 RepID=UPI000E6F8019|nr:uncharacterized protein LOC113281582 [Papaver somniferum]